MLLNINQNRGRNKLRNNKNKRKIKIKYEQMNRPSTISIKEPSLKTHRE